MSQLSESLWTWVSLWALKPSKGRFSAVTDDAQKARMRKRGAASARLSLAFLGNHRHWQQGLA